MKKSLIVIVILKNLELNHNQVLVIKKLQIYYKKNFKSFISNFFSKENHKKSFYLYGDVGVGKTMILNFFFNQIKKKKKDFTLMNLC